jgi:U6 snRNA-associated Sm-like protein LSm3
MLKYEVGFTFFDSHCAHCVCDGIYTNKKLLLYIYILEIPSLLCLSDVFSPAHTQENKSNPNPYSIQIYIALCPYSTAQLYSRNLYTTHHTHNKIYFIVIYHPKAMTSITKPLDLIKLSIGERVYIKCRGGRELEGLLHAFDSHMNMVLEDVEETVTTTDIDEETEEELVQSRKRSIEMLFVRGDVVILVSPPLRVA